MRHLRRSTSLIAAVVLAALFFAAGPTTTACTADPVPTPADSVPIFVGTVEYGSNHAGYVAPGGGGYAYIGGNGSGAQVWVGAAGQDVFVGFGPGYTNLNCVSIT